MVGTAGDFAAFLETLRTGASILTRETVELASRNQVGRLREQAEPKPGWGFGLLSGVLTDAGRAGIPAMPERCRGAESTGIRGSRIRWPSSASSD